MLLTLEEDEEAEFIKVDKNTTHFATALLSSSELRGSASTSAFSLMMMPNCAVSLALSKTKSSRCKGDN